MTDTPTDTTTEAHELITRNTVERVTPDEIEALAADPEGKRAYVGYEPSGVLHLGHMLTATKLMDLQAADMDVTVLLADIHAKLNGKGTLEEIHETAERMKEQFIAFGLDREQTDFVYGSEFQRDAEYLDDKNLLMEETSMKRAKRSMAEIASGDTAMVSQAVYPLMQALDIVHLDIDLAVGGMEQRKVHMLARDVLPKIDEDAPTCLHTPLIADLETGLGKMSSSENPITGEDSITISMEDSHEDIERKVRERAFCPPTTDPDPEDHLSSADLPEGTTLDDIELHNPVMQLFQFHVFPRFETVTVEIPDEYGGDQTFDSFEALAEALQTGDVHPADLKATLADYLNDLMAPGREALTADRSPS